MNSTLKPFAAGYWAEDANAELKNNPYPYGCQAHLDWEAGFETSRDEKWRDAS
jgi:hypothetical protein